jgi:hypothetical protein
VRFTATSAALDSILAGSRTLEDATAAGDIELTGAPAAIRRMFTAMGFPTRMLGAGGPQS